MLTEKDIAQIRNRGSDPEEVKRQLKIFEKGPTYLSVIRPATLRDGIQKFNKSDVDAKARVFSQSLPHQKVMKFVPASGAASRMFKALSAFVNENRNADGPTQDNQIIKYPDVQTFIQNIEHFPFYEDLRAVLENDGFNIDRLLENKKYVTLLEYVLEDKGLNYGQKPKGLLQFHRYESKTRTPFEEHLVEGANYCSSGQKVPLHFTISPEHDQWFKELKDNVKPEYERSLNVSFEIEFSQQALETDTIAVNPDNQPFRDESGDLVFRPGGHGALLDNVNQLDADIIFIKNIDNVVPDPQKEETYLYKKLLGSILLEFQNRIFGYLKRLEGLAVKDSNLLKEIDQFLREELCIEPPESLDISDKKAFMNYCFAKLNRPIRVCGMVENQGEPGGGPFWVKNPDGSASLQIVEKAQINTNDSQQKAILDQSTHFNPVDLVCGVKNYKGEKFHLPNYRDPEAVFISEKYQNGYPLKALELPGLWNGGMAWWNTIFVEVPISTFNPVKTINDLLRDEHQVAAKATVSADK